MSEIEESEWKEAQNCTNRMYACNVLISLLRGEPDLARRSLNKMELEFLPVLGETAKILHRAAWDLYAEIYARNASEE